MSAPYRRDTPTELAAGPVPHLVEIAVTGPAGTVPLDVAATGGLSVTFDEGWAPHVQATAVLPVPDDVETLDALDPRTGARLTVSAGYQHGDGTVDVHPLVDLGVRSRVVRRADDTLTLTAASDEALLQDDMWTAGTPAPVSRAGTVEAATDILGTSLPTVTLTTTLPAAHKAELLTALELPTGATPWSVLSTVADDAEAWIYDDGLRHWHLVDVPATVGKSAAILATGPGGTITSSEAGVTRDEWANGVYIRSEWRDTAGTDHVVHASAVIESGAFAPGTAGPKRFRYDRRTPTTPAGANAAARALLRRQSTRGRSIVLTAPAMYWLRPGATVTVQLPTGDQVRQLVARVDFDMPAGRMTVRTRHPDDVPISNGE